MDDRERERWRQSEEQHGYVRARLRVVATKDGGRHSPVLPGYRASWGFAEGVSFFLHDAPLTIEDGESIEPGAEGVVRLHPNLPEQWPNVASGMELEMFEGSRQYGIAVVLEVVPPDLG
jgi:hypothetical protein